MNFVFFMYWLFVQNVKKPQLAYVFKKLKIIDKGGTIKAQHSMRNRAIKRGG